VSFSLLFSCSTDEAVDISGSKIVCKADITDTDLSSPESNDSINELLIFTGEQIQWFNETTGELRFIIETSWSTIDLFMPFLLSHNITSIKMKILDEELFTLFPVYSNRNQASTNEPALVFIDGKFYIKKGYPDQVPGSEGNDIREENWTKIQSGWKKFIAQLQAEGRYKK
jgi:hypothetical protein